jgi:kumamolisin
MPSNQRRVVLAQSGRAPLPGARKIGPADPNQRLEVTLLLRRRSELPNLDRPGNIEGYPLSRAQFAARFGAAPDAIASIRTFASEFGIKVSSENPGARTVKVAGTVAAFTRAFEVELNSYQHAAGVFRCRDGTLTIPSGLSGMVEAVLGLDNRPQARTHFRIRKDLRGKVMPRVVQGGYDPTQVAKFYDFPAGLDGSGQSIAILELGGGYNESDLTSFFTNLKLAVPAVSAISVDGGKNSPTGDASGPDGEVELDIEVAGSISPKAQIGVYFAPNTDQGFLDALTDAAHDSNLKPSVISISWGGPESTWTTQAKNAFESVCQDAATMGITVLAASGDGGASDGKTAGTLAVDFPASSPHVTGCGGTKLVASGSTISSEQVWNELANQEGATGGGVSEFFALPVWQEDANVPAAPNGKPGRGVPDVAADADPETGYRVFVDGSATVIGGTSAVAPLWAGLIALINQSRKQPVGFLNPLIYAATVESTFNDITVGGNGGYNAGKGWDACTGLGSPNGAKLLQALGA